MKRSIILFCVFLFSCSLTYPSLIKIKNDSDYTITIKTDSPFIKDLEIKKNGTGYIESYPGTLNIMINTEGDYFAGQQKINVGYLESITIYFDIEDYPH